MGGRWEVDPKCLCVQFLITTCIDASLASYRREFEPKTRPQARDASIHVVNLLRAHVTCYTSHPSLHTHIYKPQTHLDTHPQTRTQTNNITYTHKQQLNTHTNNQPHTHTRTHTQTKQSVNKSEATVYLIFKNALD